MYVYKVVSKIDGKMYIGITNDFKQRKRAHFSALSSGTHFNQHMQRHFNKYKSKINSANEVFDMFMIYKCGSRDLAIKKEIEYIAKYKTLNSKFGFNKTPGGEANKWTKSQIKKRADKLREKSGPIYVYTVTGEDLGRYRSISDVAECFSLKYNGVNNALHRKIRYKHYVFSRKPLVFTKYEVIKQATVVIEVYENGILQDSVEGLTACGLKYGINVNTLNTYCRRGTLVKDKYRFKKTYTFDKRTLSKFL